MYCLPTVTCFSNFVLDPGAIEAIHKELSDNAADVPEVSNLTYSVKPL
jgi:hypothetical protein